ncbi:MAG TPA: S-layer homology domain-containing protein [Candidatus Omnitrophota bacterium]|nr:S-layer homology domain-containing protein [Candidatus Omnitrophota bacterium]
MRIIKGALLVSLIMLLSAAAFADTILTSDITRLGVGARPLGMGRYYTALSDDSSAVFLNPAGLSQVKTDQIMSMSGKFISQVNYFTLAAAIPSNYGTIGFGYSNSNFGFSSPVLNLVEISPGEYRVVPSTTESFTSNDNNYVVSMAYGNTFLRDDVSLGGTLKFFNESMSGSTRGNSFGIDMDLGALYRPNNIFSFGLNAKNILPSSLGGSVKWDTGLVESIPATVNLGSNVRITRVGPTNLGQLNLGADYEFTPSNTSVPGFWHLGAEWWPISFMGLRAGVDQDIIGSGSGSGYATANNPSAGLSLLFSDFEFDYAYHAYNDIPANATSYFSISYQKPKPKAKPHMLTITDPKDRTIEYNKIISVKGSVLDDHIKAVKLNSNAVALDKQGNFKTIADLQLGKNIFTAHGFDAAKKEIASAQARVTRLKSYPDVPNGYWAKEPIEYLSALGIFSGYPDGSFSPEGSVTRSEFAVMLQQYATTKQTEESNSIFKDMAVNDLIGQLVIAARDKSLVNGYPDQTFRPFAKITRAEAVSILSRFAGLVSNRITEAPYADVPGRFWAAPNIRGAKDAGLLDYIKGDNFNPSQTLTRAEAVYMLSRTSFGKSQVNDLTFQN